MWVKNWVASAIDGDLSIIAPATELANLQRYLVVKSDQVFVALLMVAECKAEQMVIRNGYIGGRWILTAPSHWTTKGVAYTGAYATSARCLRGTGHSPITAETAAHYC